MKPNKAITLAFLFTFIFLVLFIDFFHTEKYLQVKESCPACQLQSSIPNLSQYDAGVASHPPDLCLLEILTTGESSSYKQILIANPSSRSPPSA